MERSLTQAIRSFMENLEVVNELHHPNDYRRIYDIALIACLGDKGIPYDEMREEFEKALNERNLVKDRFEEAYPKYITTLEITYDVINRMKDKISIPSNFRF